MEKTLVIMAAGMGSRFGGLKQIEPVGPNKEFIIDYSVYDAKRAGFSKVVFVIKKELEDIFKETIGKRVEKYIEVEYAFQQLDDIPNKKYLVSQRQKPWGTAQAVLCAKPFVNGAFVVINADDFYGFDSYCKASKFIDESTNENEYATISFPYNVTASNFGSVKRAVCFTKDNLIEDLIESKITTMNEYALAEPLNGMSSFKIPLTQPVSVNMFVFKHSIFDYLEKYVVDYFKQSDEVVLAGEILLPELVKEKLAKNEITLQNIISNSKWLGMTYKEDLKDLESSILKLIQEGEYPNKLWE